MPRLWLPALLIVVLVAEAALGYSQYQGKATLTSAIEETQRSVAQIETKLKEVDPAKVEAQQLEAAIAGLKEMGQALEKSREELGGMSQAIVALFEVKPAEVRLASVRWLGGEAEVKGTASNYAALIRYRSQIQASPAVSSIPSFTSQVGEASIPFSLVARVGMKVE